MHCGATVHSVVGCTFRCAYCYLPDMGVSFERAQPYGLSGEEMALALLENRYFLPGLRGTYIALGSIGEPLHPVGVSRTLEYVEAFARLLHNPVQLSTKAVVSEEVARRLAAVKGAPVSPLVTIITLRLHRALEPAAPDPWRRLEGMRRMRRAGLYPVLFLRPLIPGLEDEVADLMRLAREHGAVAVVLGGLRVTPRIIERLRGAGLDVSRILSRVKRGLRPGVQVSVPSDDLKRMAAEEARRAGLIPLYSACCANTLNIFMRRGVRIPCAGLDFVDERFCARCPVDCRSIRVELDSEEVRWAVREYLGVDAVEVVEDGYRLLLEVRDAKRARRRLRERRGYRHLLEVAFRRKLVV
ncbi:MAG: radical SAM protein [Thermoproteales archaeon]|nr:radical SAM protein [Thermoproteales archaeon]